MAVNLEVIQSLMMKSASHVPIPGEAPEVLMQKQSNEALTQKQRTAETMSAAAEQATKGISATGAIPSLKPLSKPGEEEGSDDASGNAEAQHKLEMQHMQELKKRDSEIEALKHQLNIEKVHREQTISERAIQDKAKAESANIEKQKRELEDQRRQLEQDKALQENMAQAQLVKHQADMEKETAKQQATIAQDKAKAMGDIAQQNAQQYIKTTEQGRKTVDKYMAEQHKAHQQAFVSPALQSQFQRAMAATSRLGNALNKTAAFVPVPGAAPKLVKIAAPNPYPAGMPNSNPAGGTASNQQPAAGTAAQPAAVNKGQRPVVVSKPFDYGFDTSNMSQAAIDDRAAQNAARKPAAQPAVNANPSQSAAPKQPANFTASSAANLPAGFQFDENNIVSSDPRGFTVYRYGGQLYKVPTSQVVRGTAQVNGNTYLNAYKRNEGQMHIISAQDVLNNSVYYNGAYVYAGPEGAQDIQTDRQAQDLINRGKKEAEQAYNRNNQLRDTYTNVVAPHLADQGAAQRQIALAKMEGQFQDGINDKKFYEGSTRANNMRDALAVGNGLVAEDIEDVKQRAAAGDKEAQKEYMGYVAQNTQQIKQDDGFWKNFLGIDTNRWSDNPETESLVENLRRGTEPTNWAGVAGSVANMALGAGVNYFFPGLGYAVWALPQLAGGVSETNTRMDNAESMQKALGQAVIGENGASYTPSAGAVNGVMNEYGLETGGVARAKGYAQAAGLAALDAAIMHGGGKIMTRLLSNPIRRYTMRVANRMAAPGALEAANKVIANKGTGKAGTILSEKLGDLNANGVHVRTKFMNSYAQMLMSRGYSLEEATAAAYRVGKQQATKDVLRRYARMNAHNLTPTTGGRFVRGAGIATDFVGSSIPIMGANTIGEGIMNAGSEKLGYPLYNEANVPMNPDNINALWDTAYDYQPWYNYNNAMQYLDKSASAEQNNQFNTRMMQTPQGHNVSGDFRQMTAWGGIKNPYKDTQLGRAVSALAPYVSMLTGGSVKLMPSYSPYKSNIPVINSPQVAYNIVNNTEMDPRLSTTGRYLSPIHKNLANQVANSNQGGYNDYAPGAGSNLFSMPQFT